MTQSKRFYKTRIATDKHLDPMNEDIDSPDDPVYAAQIFAEMLSAISHPEFTYLDQEVTTLQKRPFLIAGFRGVQQSYPISALSLQIPP